MREFVVLEPFEEGHFRDYYDEDDRVVHSIGSYLTIYTAPTTQDEYANDIDRQDNNVQSIEII